MPIESFSSGADPFTIAYKAIFAALNASATWAGLVSQGKQIDMTSQTYRQYPKGAGPNAGDTPQVRLIQTDHDLGPFEGDSLDWQFWQEYRLEVTTDVLNLVPLNWLKFVTAAALRKAGPSLGADGLIGGIDCKMGRDSNYGKPGESDPGSDGSRRWVAVTNIRVFMYVADSVVSAIP